MAWVEGDAVVWEQGLDALIKFEMFSDVGSTQEWPFPGWDVNAVLGDGKRTEYDLTVVLDQLAGIVKVIAPEALINSLKITKTYWLNVLMVAPGNLQADDHHLAYLPVTIAPRQARRDS